MRTPPLQKLAVAGLAAALVLGGAVAVGAQDDEGSSRSDGHGVLAGLVADGTLTEDQAEAVRDGIRDRRQQRRATTSAVAEAIGIERRELLGRLRDGESIAAVAEAEGVERQVVVDALVAASDGRLDEAQAERIVDATRPHPR